MFIHSFIHSCTHPSIFSFIYLFTGSVVDTDKIETSAMSDAEGDKTNDMSFTEWISDSESESENDDLSEYCEDDFGHFR